MGDLSKESFIKVWTAARNLVSFLALQTDRDCRWNCQGRYKLPEATFRPMLIIVILVSFNISSICSRVSPRISSSMFLSLSLPAVFTLTGLCLVSFSYEVFNLWVNYTFPGPPCGCVPYFSTPVAHLTTSISLFFSNTPTHISVHLSQCYSSLFHNGPMGFY